MSYDQDKVNSYNERRRLEAENAMLREKRENDRLKGEAQAADTLSGFAALMAGKGYFAITPEHGGWTIRFHKDS